MIYRSEWKFGDVELGGRNMLVTAMSGAEDLPPVRGEDPEIPLREGRLAVEKRMDARVVSLGLVVHGESIVELEYQLDQLRKLMGSRGRQYLQRTMANGHERRALAEVVRFTPQRESPHVMRVVAEFALAEPFFRAVQETKVTQAVGAVSVNFEVTNGGTATDRSAVIKLTGPLNYPKLTDLLTGVWVGYNAAIGALETVTIDTAAFSCKLGSTSLLDKLVHSGDTYFMALAPGANLMKIETSGTTGGSMEISFHAPFY